MVGSRLNALFKYLVENHIRLPFRQRRSGFTSEIDWRMAAKTTVYGLLKHPLYAGTYGYGRERTRPSAIIRAKDRAPFRSKANGSVSREAPTL